MRTEMQIINDRLILFKQLLDTASIDWSNKRIMDWTQFNWEFIVESAFIQQEIYLDVYAEGADCYGKSSRICFPEKLPTHKVLLQPKDGSLCYDVLNQKNIDLTKNDFFLEELVSFDQWYYRRPPFNYVLSYNNENIESIFDIQCLNFVLVPI